MSKPIARVLNLIDPASQRLEGTSLAEAEARLLAEDPAAALGIRGSFAWSPATASGSASPAASSGRCSRRPRGSVCHGKSYWSVSIY